MCCEASKLIAKAFLRIRPCLARKMFLTVSSPCVPIIQALERELAPVEERLHTLTGTARQVASANPSEAKAVRERQSEITALWENLKVKV